jgi:hypothetical protein
MTHHDYGEGYFETLLHTTRSGTVVRDMDNYIDRTFTQYDFVDYLPSNATSVLAVIEADTWKYGYLPMQGLNTSVLPGFANRSLGHIDFDYGYNGGQVYMGEEWNPVKVYGSSSYNPYGHKLVAAATLYTAIENGLSKAMVM